MSSLKPPRHISTLPPAAELSSTHWTNTGEAGVSIFHNLSLQQKPNSQKGIRSQPIQLRYQMETSLYAPVKQFLENLGFHVKGEIGGSVLLRIAESTRPSS